MTAPTTRTDTREQALQQAAELAASQRGAQVSEVRALSAVVVFTRKQMLQRFVYGGAPLQWTVR